MFFIVSFFFKDVVFNNLSCFVTCFCRVRVSFFKSLFLLQRNTENKGKSHTKILLTCGFENKLFHLIHVLKSVSLKLSFLHLDVATLFTDVFFQPCECYLSLSRTLVFLSIGKVFTKFST